MNASEDRVRIERDVNAPIEEVWRMWTDPEQFKSWYGPMGFSVPIAEMDLVEGGTRKVCMQMKTSENTMTMWFTGVYKEISAPHRLCYTESMCDADGNILSPQSMGMPEGSPETTEVLVDLKDSGGKTALTLVHAGVPAGSPGESGWTQALDKLAAQLS